MGLLGLALTILALLAAGTGLALALRAARRGSADGRLRRLAAISAGSAVAANVVMVVALLTHDFSIDYVAQVGSRATPPLYAAASLWGALEGSILFWVGLLATMTWLHATRTRPSEEGGLPLGLAVLFGLLVFFLAIVVGPGSPWGQVSPVPADGPGPNPLLQDHPLMAIHPPLLYLGFVGLSVPFAITVAALVERRLDRSWLAAARRWTLPAWVFLTAGLVTGSWWSYAVLGWGGYWAWDPVENVALLPWLTATAFIHSAMLHERRGALTTWNVALVVGSFALTILATFVTRSGILASVHAFAQSPVGILFLGLLAAVLAGSIVLAVWRLPDERADRTLGTRGLAFLANNVMLVALAVTILVGTLYPLFVEALGGGQVSVGAPYFERVVGPVALALLVLLGLGPALPWGAWTPRDRQRLLPGAVAAAVAAVALHIQAAPPEQVLGSSVAGFALVQSGVYLGRHLVTRRAADGRGRGPASPLGALLAHMGVGIVALVVVSAAAGHGQVAGSLRVGETLHLGDYGVTLSGLESEALPGRSVVRAVAAAEGPRVATEVRPALVRFGGGPQAIASPAILPGPLLDLYVTLLDADVARGTASLRVDIQPLMSWLWVGGFLAAAGGLLSALARSRAERRSRT